mgnify:CR=1 FL=1
MKLFKIVLVTLLVAGVIKWVRQGRGFSILESLPIVGGHELSRYDVAAVIMLAIMLWGMARMARRDVDDGSNDSRYDGGEDDDE